MAVYLVRHGKSIANKGLVLSGSCDHPLTDLGREQARQAGRAMRGVQFAMTFSSELCRAVETAEIIMEDAGSRPEISIRDPRLNERDFGIYEDVAQMWISDNHGPDVLQRVHADVTFRMERGESIGDVYERVACYFDEAIRPAASVSDVLVVSHGNVTKCLLAHCVGWPLAIIPEIPMWNGLVTRLNV